MEKTKNFYQFSAPLLCPNGLFMWKLGETKRRQLSEWVSRLGLLAVSIWIESKICNSKVHEGFIWNIIGNIVEKTKILSILCTTLVSKWAFYVKNWRNWSVFNQERERERVSRIDLLAASIWIESVLDRILKFMEFSLWILLNPVPTRLCDILLQW